jgi:hypothetical protein
MLNPLKKNIQRARLCHLGVSLNKKQRQTVEHTIIVHAQRRMGVHGKVAFVFVSVSVCVCVCVLDP